MNAKTANQNNPISSQSQQSEPEPQANALVNLVLKINSNPAAQKAMAEALATTEEQLKNQ